MSPSIGPIAQFVAVAEPRRSWSVRLGDYDSEAEDEGSSQTSSQRGFILGSRSRIRGKDGDLFVCVARSGLLELGVAPTRSRASLPTAKAAGAFDAQIDWLRGRKKSKVATWMRAISSKG